jgi:hypothetical protein
MKRILVWLLGVPIGLVFLTAWGHLSNHDVNVVKQPVADERHHSGSG